MSRKTSGDRTPRAAGPEKGGKTTPKTPSSTSKSARTTRSSTGRPSPGRKKAAAATQPRAASEPPAAEKPASAKKSATRAADRKSEKVLAAAALEASAEQIISRAEADITSAIDSLNTQMNAALAKLTEVAIAHCDRGKAVVRTAPLDRATATFHRLVAEIVDDQLAEMLPPIVTLRNELDQWAADETNAPDEQNDRDPSDLCRRATETLDHVLSLAGVQSYTPRIGDRLDTLIHLAVGETQREDLDDGAIAETLQPGFRTARGKVIAPARVKVNRR